jgi:hypothetical protein
MTTDLPAAFLGNIAREPYTPPTKAEAAYSFSTSSYLSSSPSIPILSQASIAAPRDIVHPFGSEKLSGNYMDYAHALDMNVVHAERGFVDDSSPTYHDDCGRSRASSSHSSSNESDTSSHSQTIDSPRNEPLVICTVHGCRFFLYWYLPVAYLKVI